MYTVYSDNTLIHDGVSPDLDIHLIDPNLTIGDSIAGSFDMTIQPANPGYFVVNRFTSLIKIKRDGRTLWIGRVIKENKDFWNRRKCSCEGALAFLNDTNQELHTYSSTSLNGFINILINVHNSKSINSHKINVGIITVADMNDDHVYQTNYGSTWDEFKTNCLDRLNGHVRLRYVEGSDIPYFDYLADYPNTATQEINFGYNLLDFTRNWDLSDLCTVLIPRGKQLDEEDDNGQKNYVTVASVNSGSIYVVNQQAYNTFGRIEQVVDFSEIEEPSVLLQIANAYISIQQFDQMVMTVNAVDLHKLTRNTSIYIEDEHGDELIDSSSNRISGYLIGIHDQNNSNVAAFNLLDEVRCISRPHGLDRLFPITEIQIPLDKPDGVTYTMGGSGGTTMSSNNNRNTSIVLDRIKNLPSIKNILGLAKQQAAQILNQRTTGYVTITEVDDSSEALIISNTPDWQNATKRWMFNINGLGYTKDQGQTYDIAITMDGTIVADFIKTGVLEDGYGLNWWNLTTGEINLSYNTQFQDINGNHMTIVDVNDLANTANTNAVNAGEAANTVNTKVETEKKRQTGSTNLLNGTNILTGSLGRPASTDWSLGKWSSSSNCNGNTKIVDISNSPNQKILVGILFTVTQTVQDGFKAVVQSNVPLGLEQAYCISCYAKGTGSLKFMIGKSINNQPMYATATKTVSDGWKRYHLVFATGKENTYSDSKYTAGMISGKTDVYIGVVAKNGSSVTICGMKLERGNTPTDWGESDFDIQYLANGYTDKTAENVMEASCEYTDAQTDKLETFTKKYVENISDADRDFTKAQREALDESFNQYKILQRLTQNFTRKGIYLQNNELYMNATYIRTGTLDAGIVKTGILTDVNGKNKWNMLTGYLYTKNMEAVNAKLSGVFECGDYYKIQLDDGVLYGFKNNSYVGSIDYSATMYNIDKQKNYTGLMMRSKGGMQIRMPMISIRNKNDNGIATTCFTGKKEFWFVGDIRGNGNGGISWTKYTHGIEVINGLVTSVW